MACFLTYLRKADTTVDAWQFYEKRRLRRTLAVPCPSWRRMLLDVDGAIKVGLQRVEKHLLQKLVILMPTIQQHFLDSGGTYRPKDWDSFSVSSHDAPQPYTLHPAHTRLG